jgi:polysaccharide transporter, PST family
LKLALFNRNTSSEWIAILSNTGWLFADRVLRMTVGFIIGVWIARYLGAEQYGLLSYATAFVYLFNPLITLGLDNVVIRDIVDDPETKNELLGTTFRLKLLGGALAFIGVMALIAVVRPNEPLVLGLTAILAAATSLQAFETIDLWFQSQVQSKYTVLAKNFAFFGIAALKIFLLIKQAPLVAFAWASFAEMVIASVALIAIYRFKGHSFTAWQWRFPLAKSLLRESFPLLLSGLTIMIYMKIDQIMLGQMIGDRAVGIYAAATRISEAWYFIPTAIVSSVTPSIYKARKQSEAAYYRYVGRLLRAMNGIAIAVAVPVTILAPSIIQLCYGKDYLSSSSVLVVHIWAAIFVFMGVATLPYFIAEGLTQLTLRRTVLGAIINVVLNFFLIPSYMGVGAAIATVISQAVASYLSHAFHPRTRKLFWIQTRSLLLLP